MGGQNLQAIIEAFRNFVSNRGWSISDEKEIQHGYQLTVTDGITKIPVALYSSGKALVQGKVSPLQTELTVLAYPPERYNKIYKETGNLNLLLAKAHAQAIAKIAKVTACKLAIVDQFGNEALVRDALARLGCTIAVEQRPRAEDNVAVAAASIVARAEFVRQLAELSRSVGMDLPKGASNPQIVTVGRQIIAKGGQQALARVAKLHFKTTETILQK